MKWPFITRELIVVARGQLAAAVVFHIAVLAGFTAIWGLKLPMLTGRGIYDFVRTFEPALLTILLPWVAARCYAPDRGPALITLSALTARRPSAIVLNKIVAGAGVLALVVLTGVPPAIVAQKMSAIPLSIVVRDFGSFVAFALLASVVTTGWLLRTDNPITSWIGASATTAVVLVSTSSLQLTQLAQDLAIVFVGVACAAGLVAWSDRSFRYCDA
jgi:hypothetical protein